ncbi:MAG: hypothetical protein CM15mV42_1220 [uncultured marine virus]|nr:MAG: hypothetical protein CM15mV42_1220 [uncultured marine virus]
MKKIIPKKLPIGKRGQMLGRIFFEKSTLCTNLKGKTKSGYKVMD